MLTNLQATLLLPDIFSFVTHLTIATSALIKEKEERPLLPQALVLNISSPKKLAPITKGNISNIVPIKLTKDPIHPDNQEENQEEDLEEEEVKDQLED